MNSQRYLRNALCAAVIAGAAAIAAPGQAVKSVVAVKPETVPVTTKSPKAREAYERAMMQREDLLYVELGLESMRDAVKADPRFALAHAALAYFTTDPAEERRERALSLQYLAGASPDEKLLIRWMNGVKNGQIVPAIAAMNDLLASYPNDKRLANLDAEWLCSGQQNFDLGEEVLDRVLKNDPGFYPALNNIAYCYALGGKVNLAPAFMERYVAALPSQPNPQDSYAEILRMAGDYPGALEHYRAALKIDPQFTSSQVGIASTYALMGDEESARAEYLKAIEMSSDRGTKLNYRILWALTYYRENKGEQAHKAYMDLVGDARREGFPLQEAECFRTKALFHADPADALADLSAAERIINRQQVLSHEDRDTEIASIQQDRAFIAVRSNMPGVAEKAGAAMARMAQNSRNNLVQQCYHSANGAALLLQGKFEEAIAELQYDPRNPLSLQMLREAQTRAGRTSDAEQTLATLAAVSDERVETAVAAMPARAALKANPSSAPHGESARIGGPLR
jgi:predicted Zn-dependent protease